MTIIKKPYVWPVIHVNGPAEALEDAYMVVEAGCDGLFFIQMQGRDEYLDELVELVKAKYPRFQVGVNYLGTNNPSKAFLRAKKAGADATWLDNCYIRADGIEAPGHQLIDVFNMNTDIPTDHLIFAAAAFKYQKIDPKPKETAELLRNIGFIPTTSGDATGFPPTVEKLSSMFNGELAVASGIDHNNVEELGKYVSHILIATGISDQFLDRISKSKLELFMERVNELRNAG